MTETERKDATKQPADAQTEHTQPGFCWVCRNKGRVRASYKDGVWHRVAHYCKFCKREGEV